MLLQILFVCLQFCRETNEVLMIETDSSYNTYRVLKIVSEGHLQDPFVSFRVKTCESVSIGLLPTADDKFIQEKMTYVRINKDYSQIVVNNITRSKRNIDSTVLNCDNNIRVKMQWNDTGITGMIRETDGSEWIFNQWYGDITTKLSQVEYVGFLSSSDATWVIQKGAEFVNNTDYTSTTTIHYDTSKRSAVSSDLAAFPQSSTTSTESTTTKTTRTDANTNSKTIKTTEAIDDQTDKTKDITTETSLTKSPSTPSPTKIETTTKTEPVAATTSAILTLMTTSQPNISTCSCVCVNVTTTSSSACTQNDVNCIVAELKAELTVDILSLSSSIRKKISAGDDRPSAQAIGVVGAILLALSVSLIVIPDVFQLVRYLYHNKATPPSYRTKTQKRERHDKNTSMC